MGMKVQACFCNKWDIISLQCLWRGMKAEPTTHNLTLGPRPQAEWDQELTWDSASNQLLSILIQNANSKFQQSVVLQETLVASYESASNWSCTTYHYLNPYLWVCSEGLFLLLCLHAQQFGPIQLAVSEPYLATLPAPERILLSNLSLTMAVEFQFPAKNL